MDIRIRMNQGNEDYRKTSSSERRLRTAKEGQHPYAIVICCSDSRVVPEYIFKADIGDLFVIRVAGNVLDNHQLGSVEALSGHSDGFIQFITDEIQEAVGEEKDPGKACRLNVLHAMKILEKEFAKHPEIERVEISGAVYDIESGQVEWME